MIRRDRTICAPATSPGGALTVIRLSGPETFRILARIFFPSGRKKSFDDPRGYKVFHGYIRDEDGIIDEVLVSAFRMPHSYTGEDSAEISCHGSSYIVTRILELLVRNGAVTALPGEFTQRAFLNGKMDLSQAEAVADLVSSSTRASHRIAINQIRGGFSSEIVKIRSDLLHFASMLELELDFGEEDVKFADRKELLALATSTREVCTRLSESFRLGNVIKNGIPVVIAGKPNSGKSTLLNALLNEERAIVSEIPGTTRDTIEDVVNLNGLNYRFIDTAGLRDTSDIIENLGIKKTHEKIMQSSVVILVDEATENPLEINRRAGSVREMISESQSRLFILINKTDLVKESQLRDLANKIRPEGSEILLFLSALKREGLDTLKARLAEVIEGDGLSDEDVVISNIRHFEALCNVSESMERVISGLKEMIPEDLVAIDLRHAIHYLGEITGEITTDEILGNIFKNFCIGK